jgi:large subunit ribosomal protein L17
MRHLKRTAKLGRTGEHRNAMLANMVCSLIKHNRIQTTLAKAKEVRPIAEKMITLARKGDIHSRRQALAYLRSQDVVHQLFSNVAPRFNDRPGGYSRIVKLGPRQGDAAEMAYLELVDFDASA